jgi:hypothetical protein
MTEFRVRLDSDDGNGQDKTTLGRRTRRATGRPPKPTPLGCSLAFPGSIPVSSISSRQLPATPRAVTSGFR